MVANLVNDAIYEQPFLARRQWPNVSKFGLVMLMLTTYITDYHLMITSLLNMRQPCKPLFDHAGATYRYHNCNHHPI